MDYIKLDTGILNSSLWIQRADRDIFITALLMAYPCEFKEPLRQIAVGSLELTGYEIPPGWYGFIEAAGPGIVRRALVPHDEGMLALERLCAPDTDSRSARFEGRRLMRINHGYIALNYIEYMLRDNKGAERVRRFRERQKILKGNVTVNSDALQTGTCNVKSNYGDGDGDGDGDITRGIKDINGLPAVKDVIDGQSQSSIRFDDFWTAYPKKVKRKPSEAIWKRRHLDEKADVIIEDIQSRKKADDRWLNGYIPDPTTYLNQERWTDEITKPQENRSGTHRKLSAVEVVREATAKRARERGETE